MHSDNHWFRVRLGATYVLLACILGAVCFRLAQLQLMEDPELQTLAKRQFSRPVRKSQIRVPIFDRNGSELAATMAGGSVYAHPDKIKSRQKASRMLAQTLGHTTQYWSRRLKTKKKFVWLKRKIDAKVAKKIKEASIEGIHVKPSPLRIYPNETLAANVLGFVGIDGDGLAGVELAFNDQLVVEERLVDSIYSSQPSVLSQEIGEKGSSGHGLFLTLDRNIQNMLEEEIERTHKSTKAKAVMGVVFDPSSGEILAVGQSPSFDPNRATQFSPRTYSNRVVSHLFEPGSTMKVLLAAEVLERGVYEPESILDCNNGKLKIGRVTVREADVHHHFKELPLSKVITYSSNIGAVRMAQKLGQQGVRSAMHRFGLLDKTESGLPAEANAQIKPLKQWTPLLTATTAYGQGFSVTPLQMVRAFGIIANGGFAIKPRIQKGKAEKPVRVLSTQTAASIKKMLIDVTEDEHGTGRGARVPGIVVGGKTGTAQKYTAKEGYRGGKYFSSFIGFAPAENPKIVVGIFVDEPDEGYYASEVAVPAFQSVVSRTLHYMDKIPSTPIVQAPSVKLLASARPLDWAKHGDDWVLPSLEGRSLREMFHELSPKVSGLRLKGSGYVVKQSPAPGTVVSAKSRISLELAPN